MTCGTSLIKSVSEGTNVVAGRLHTSVVLECLFGRQAFVLGPALRHSQTVERINTERGVSSLLQLTRRLTDFNVRLDAQK